MRPYDPQWNDMTSTHSRREFLWSVFEQKKQKREQHKRWKPWIYYRNNLHDYCNKEATTKNTGTSSVTFLSAVFEKTNYDLDLVQI